MSEAPLLEQIELVERLIAMEPKASPSRPIMKTISAGLRARLETAPSAAEVALSAKIDAAKRAKVPGWDYPPSRMITIADELIGRWPVVKQALERFGAEIEQEMTS